MNDKPAEQSKSRQAATQEGSCCRSNDEVGAASKLRQGLEVTGISLALGVAYLALRQLEWLPGGVAVSDNLSFGLVFLIGLAASVSTCMAVTGGLLLAFAARYGAAETAAGGSEKFALHGYFNAGRIVGYGLLGAAVGFLGSALQFSAAINGALMLAASVIMIVLGLQMSGLLPSLGVARRLLPRADRIRIWTAEETRPAAFILGASTFFFPCGFTQALQLYVLAHGSAVTGALTMLTFALGTLPALLSLSAITSFARGSFQRFVVKVAAAAVIFLGVVNIQYGLVLTASSVTAPTGNAQGPAVQSAGHRVPLVDGVQVASMKIVGLEYSPHRFAVRPGIPVLWRIDASEADGCGVVLIVPKIGVRRLLSVAATNVITFTPNEIGDIEFNCGMGMMTPDSKFTVVATSG